MRTLFSVATWCVGGILLWGAAEKVLHWQHFLQVLEGYTFVPSWSVGGCACAVLVLEAYAGGSVLLVRTRSLGLVLATALFALFAGAVGFLLITRPGSSCGCVFSIGQGKADLPHLLLNLSLMMLSLYLVAMNKGQQSERLPPSSVGAPCLKESSVIHQRTWRSL